MKIIRNDKQKESLAKMFWDMDKVFFTILVIGPLANPEPIGAETFLSGSLIGLLSFVLGYLIDGMEVKK